MVKNKSVPFCDKSTLTLLIKRDNKMKIRSILITLFLISFISSCGTMPGMSVLMAKKEAVKLRPEYQHFQKLCENKEFTNTNKRIYVDGYLSASTTGSICSDRWSPVFEYGYKFHECSEKKITNYSSLFGGNSYSFEVAQEGSSDCIDRDNIQEEILERYKSKLEGNKCLAKKIINKPKSKYAKILEFGHVDPQGAHKIGKNRKENNKNIIGYNGYSIINMQKGERLVVLSRKYTYTPETGNDYIGSFKCEIESEDRLSDILVPN